MFVVCYSNSEVTEIALLHAPSTVWPYLIIYPWMFLELIALPSLRLFPLRFLFLLFAEVVWPSLAYMEVSRFVLSSTKKKKIESPLVVNVEESALKKYYTKSFCSQPTQASVETIRKSLKIVESNKHHQHRKLPRKDIKEVLDGCWSISPHTLAKDILQMYTNVLVEVASSVLLLEQVIEWNKRWEEWLDNDGKVEFFFLLVHSPLLNSFRSIVVCAVFLCIS